MPSREPARAPAPAASAKKPRATVGANGVTMARIQNPKSRRTTTVKRGRGYQKKGLELCRLTGQQLLTAGCDPQGRRFFVTSEMPDDVDINSVGALEAVVASLEESTRQARELLEQARLNPLPNDGAVRVYGQHHYEQLFGKNAQSWKFTLPASLAPCRAAAPAARPATSGAPKRSTAKPASARKKKDDVDPEMADAAAVLAGLHLDRRAAPRIEVTHTVAHETQCDVNGNATSTTIDFHTTVVVPTRRASGVPEDISDAEACMLLATRVAAGIQCAALASQTYAPNAQAVVSDMLELAQGGQLGEAAYGDGEGEMSQAQFQALLDMAVL